MRYFIRFSTLARGLFSGCSLFLKCSVEAFNDFMVYVPFVRAEPSGKTIRNVQKFMNDSLFPVLNVQPVIPLRYDFDYIGGRKVKRLLPYSAKTMNSSNRASGFGSLTPDAEHELLDNVEEI